ncbi:MAG: Spore protein YkvP [bacterium ADurb.Bin363]|nr:MAG: Spore protein YkvP [bacterium ADurb.Bin363]
MKTVLVITESLEPGNFHRGVVNGFRQIKDIESIALYCPRDVSFPYSVYNELILHKASKFKIDILFAIQAEAIGINTIKTLNDRGIKTVIWNVDDPFLLFHANNSKIHRGKCREYQYVYSTNIESINRHYPKLGIKAKFLPFGYDPVFHKDLKLPKKFDTSFVGSSFHNRTQNYISKIKNIDLFGCKNKLWTYPYRVTFSKMIEIANQSKINLNFSDQPSNSVRCLKNRVIEIIGAGQFLLSEDFPESNRLFEIDKELVIFNSLKELTEKINYYLSHNKEREKIARAGYKKVKENYSYKKLLSGVLEDLK